MNIYVYSDESGVFDKEHNDIFVFGGIIILGSEDKNIWSRKYAAAEKVLMKHYGNKELKATVVSNRDKNKLFRSLNHCYKFGVIINEKWVIDSIFKSKKDKQRYLDYVYKMAVKSAFENLIQHGIIQPMEIERIYFYIDEHTTATNGKYELQQSLEQEFKYGTYNFNYSNYFPPIFPKMKDVNVEFCDSKSKLLVRAADIVSNKIFYRATNNLYKELNNIQNLHVIRLP